jgi:hypothetical protein
VCNTDVSHVTGVLELIPVWSVAVYLQLVFMSYLMSRFVLHVSVVSLLLL